MNYKLSEPQKITANAPKFKAFVDRFRNSVLVCNNPIYGGDCYGDTYCNEFACNHRVLKCACPPPSAGAAAKGTHRKSAGGAAAKAEQRSCSHGFCGCCYHHRRELVFIVCPFCHTVPKGTGQTMADYWKEMKE